MNRILKRPMFRIGGSAGTGITSGLDQPRKQYSTGTNPYAMGSFQATGLPGFLTQFGLNLLSTPPQGNIFATAATAARDPFNLLQASQVESMKTASDRKFARELAAEEREFEESQLEKKIAAEKEIAGMNISDRNKRIEAIADKNYEGDIIKAQREVDFPTTVYPGLKEQYGDKQVSTAVIDTSILSTPKKIDKFVDQNPFLASKVVYDVATDTAMRVVKDRLTGQFVLIPADSADIDTTGDDMPAPESPRSFDYFNPKQKKKIEELGSEFSDEFYTGA
tara:strand:- start:97 stop:933 length:837 start_codon:yes stop_codon:yes gene_type:complete